MHCLLASINMVIDISGLWYLCIFSTLWQDNSALRSAKSHLTSQQSPQLIVCRFYHEFTEEISQQVEDIWILQQQGETVQERDRSQREVHPGPAGSQAEAGELPHLQELLRLAALQLAQTQLGPGITH